MSAENKKYLSPNQKAWKRFKRNKPAMFGIIVIVLSFFIAIFGYWIAPDKTPYANDQILQIATEKSGFSIDILKTRKNQEINERGFFSRLWGGQESPYTLIPINSYRFEGDQIIVDEYTGDTGSVNEVKVNMADVVYPISVSDPTISSAGSGLSFKDINENSITISTADLQQKIETNHIENRTYLFGTDKFGRDNLSRLILGVRISLSVGIVAILISLLIGLTLGATAGFYRKKPPRLQLGSVLAIPLFLIVLFGMIFALLQANFAIAYWGKLLGLAIGAGILQTVLNKFTTKRISINVDEIIMFIINVFWSIPFLLLVFALVIALGRKSWQIYLAVGLTMWVEVARIVRGQIMSVREQEFVEAAYSMGFSDFRAIFKHVLPNILGPVIVITAANFASAIIIEAGLSFLGIGVQPPQPSWGTMLKEYYGYIGTNKAFLALLPGTAILILVLAFNLVGNGLRDALDVKTRA